MEGINPFFIDIWGNLTLCRRFGLVKGCNIYPEKNLVALSYHFTLYVLNEGLIDFVHKISILLWTYVAKPLTSTSFVAQSLTFSLLK